MLPSVAPTGPARRHPNHDETIQKAEAALEQAQTRYAAYQRAAREARARLAATPKGKAFLTLRKSTRLAKAALLTAREKRMRADQEEKNSTTVYPWTRFKAKDSPFPMGK
jgi:hypothetical protein